MWRRAAPHACRRGDSISPPARQGLVSSQFVPLHIGDCETASDSYENMAAAVRDAASKEKEIGVTFRSDIAVVIQACDRIAAIADDKSIPLKQRLLAVKDAMSEVVRRDA